MSDRLAVFNAGQIEQIGSPAEVYERPASVFVANFVGTSNVLGDGRAVRPEKLRLERPDYALQPGEEARLGTIADVVYLGPITRYVVRLRDGTALAEIVVEYPIGHKRRRAAGIPLLVEKFRTNLARRFDEKQQRAILDVSLDQNRLETMQVSQYVDLYAA